MDKVSHGSPSRRPTRWSSLAALAALLAVAAAWSTAAADSTDAARSGADVPRLTVGRVTVRYLRPVQGAPSRQDIMANMTVNLHRVRAGYTAPAPDGPSLPYQLNEQTLHNARFSVSAIQAMQDAIRQYINDQGVIGVFVYAADASAAETPDGPDALNFAAVANNSKPINLQMVIVLGVVKNVRTISTGPRVQYPLLGPKTDPLARQIRKNSPIHPGQPLVQAELQDYLDKVNRQPGPSRHVDVNITTAEGGGEGDVDLDYTVRYVKPWNAYVQAYNGGTRQTNEWQERFGFTDNELTGHDDIFVIEYDPASFTGTYSADASYDFPVLDSQDLRARVYGSADRFNSSNLAITDESLVGDSQEIGAEGVYNVFQWHQLFVDAVGGAKIDNYFVNSKTTVGSTTPGVADGAFFLPYAGARLTRATDLVASAASVDFEFDPINPNSPDSQNLQRLGRFNVDPHFMILQASASHSFYIEPLLEGWDERDKQSRPTAANEMFFSGQGQWALSDARLPPELEETAGGLYSVRGYPESLVSGDTVIYGTAEYRLHVPRLLGIASGNSLLNATLPPPPLINDNGSFAYQPRAAEVPGDFDFIVKGFVDGGVVHDNKSFRNEPGGTTDAGLVSIGTGVELHLKENVSIRCDYGVALTPVHEPDVNVDRGASRVSLVFTLLY